MLAHLVVLGVPLLALGGLIAAVFFTIRHIVRKRRAKKAPVRPEWLYGASSTSTGRKEKK